MEFDPKLTMAPADGNRVETVAGGGYRDQRPRGAESAALPMSENSATGAKIYEKLVTKYKVSTAH